MQDVTFVCLCVLQVQGVGDREREEGGEERHPQLVRIRFSSNRHI